MLAGSYITLSLCSCSLISFRPTTPGALFLSRCCDDLSVSPELVATDHFLLLGAVASGHLILGFSPTSLDTLSQSPLLVSLYCPDF